MDVTNVFRELTSSSGPDRNALLLTNPLLLAAMRALERIERMRTKLAETDYTYVDYDRFLRRGGVIGGMSQEKREMLDMEVQTFLIECTTSLKEFKRLTGANNSDGSKGEHFSQISGFLFDRLHALSTAFTQMKRRHRRYNVNPMRLFGDMQARDDPALNTVVAAASPPPKAQKGSKANSNATSEGASISSSLSSSSAGSGEGGGVAADFAERYTSEVATTAKLREYDRIASNHREKYLRETKELRNKFSQEAMEAESISRNINDIGDAFTEFLAVLASQQESVQEIHEAAQVAREEVSETAQELNLTLERSKSHNATMISIYVGLTLLLLFIDWISP